MRFFVLMSFAEEEPEEEMDEESDEDGSKRRKRKKAKPAAKKTPTPVKKKVSYGSNMDTISPFWHANNRHLCSHSLSIVDDALLQSPAQSKVRWSDRWISSIH